MADSDILTWCPLINVSKRYLSIEFHLFFSKNLKHVLLAINSQQLPECFLYGKMFKSYLAYEQFCKCKAKQCLPLHGWSSSSISPWSIFCWCNRIPKSEQLMKTSLYLLLQLGKAKFRQQHFAWWGSSCYICSKP